MNAETPKAPIDIAFLDSVSHGDVLLMIDGCSRLEIRLGSPMGLLFRDDQQDCCMEIWDEIDTHENLDSNDPDRLPEADIDELQKGAQACYLTPEHMAHELGFGFHAAEMMLLFQCLRSFGSAEVHRALQAARPYAYVDRGVTPRTYTTHNNKKR